MVAGGDDKLDGGDGNDELSGGSGTDWAYFSSGISDYTFRALAFFYFGYQQFYGYSTERYRDVFF